MNLKKEIFERISAIEKVELSEVKKIELALIDDANKAIADGQKNEANLYSDFKTSLNNIIKKGGEIESKYNSLLSSINEPIFQMEKQAKELGLDFKQTETYKKAQSIIVAIEKRKEVVNDIIDNIQKYGF